MYEYKFYVTPRDHISYFSEYKSFLSTVKECDGERFILLDKDDHNRNEICLNLDQCLFVAQLELPQSNAMESAEG